MAQEFYKKITLILGLISVLLLAIVSLWQLPHSPATWFDEGINLGIAKSLIEKGVYNLQIAPDKFVETRVFLITTNYPVLFPIAGFIKLFGSNLLGSRIPMVIFMLAFVLAIYILTKRLYGQENAIIAVALIASFTPLYGNGKAVLGEIPGLLYFILGLLLLKTTKGWQLTVAGLLFGLSAATKPFFLIIFPAIIVGEIYNESFNSRSVKRLLLIGGGATLPILGWLYSILPSFSLSAFKTMTNYYANSYAASNFLVTIWQNALRFFTETTPIHFALLIVAALLAVYLKFKNQEKPKKIEVILLSFIAINVLWYLKTPGWYRYFFTAHVLAFIFFPAALKIIFEKLKDLLKNYFNINPKNLTLIIVLALFALQTSILISKRNDPLYYSNEASKIAEYANNSLKINGDVLIINAPSIAFLLNTPNLYQYLQINPNLAFGEPKLKNAADAPFEFIIARSLDGINIPKAAEIINSNYEQLQFGPYSLYSLKK